MKFKEILFKQKVKYKIIKKIITNYNNLKMKGLTNFKKKYKIIK